MQEFFMSMVMATTIGNFMAFFAMAMALGVFSIKYESPHEIGIFASFIGYLMLGAVAILGFVNGWVVFWGYVVAAILVAIIQVSVVDIRRMQKIRESKNGMDATNISYRWIHFKNHDKTKAEVNVDRGDLAAYIISYVSCAPFLIICWVFHELLQNLSEWIAENIGGMLKRKLERIFGIDELNQRKGM